MRILLLENVSEIGLPQFEPTNPQSDGTSTATDNHPLKIYHWNVAGINSCGSSEQLYPTINQNFFDSSRLQLLLQDKRKFAVLDAATLQLHSLEGTTSIAEDCVAISLSTDGKLVFGLQWSEEFVVLCHPHQDVKHIRSGDGMTIGKQNSLYKRIVSRFQGLFGTTSGSTLGESDPNKIDPIDALFPLLAPSNDGLALLCFFKPGEGFLFICNYNPALRHKHICNVIGSKVQGSWCKINMDEDVVLAWAKDKGLPSVETQLFYLQKDQDDARSVKGTVVYSAFANQRLEMLYGMLSLKDKDKDQYEMQWGLLKFELDLVIPDIQADARESIFLNTGENVKEDNPHFVMKMNSKADQIALAVNTHAGVYIHIQDLPGTISDVKLERVSVPLCSHCDYGNAIYYDKECWVSCVEWVAEDCYLAVSTRCGCISFFHKTGEPIITKVADGGQLVKDKCDFFTPIFDGRGPKTSPLATSKNIPEMHSPSEINLKWCGPGMNVLAISNGSKVYVQRIIRVANYKELSNIQVASALSFAKSLTSNDIVNRSKSKPSFHGRPPSSVRLNERKASDNNMGSTVSKKSLSNFDTGEQNDESYRTINSFVKDLPQAEIILRPVMVQKSSSSVNGTRSRNFPIEFRFPNLSTTVLSVEAEPVQFPSKEKLREVEKLQEITEESPLTQSENLKTTFELVHLNSTPRSYYLADDEGTEHTDDDKLELRLESSCRSEMTATVTDNDSCKPDESDVVSLVDDSPYSPPFTEQEDEGIEEGPQETNELGNLTDAPQFIRLTLPQSPNIEGVIPFAPINLTEDPTFIGQKLPSVRSATSTRSRSPNKTGVLEDSHGGKSICIIASETSVHSLDRKFSIISPMLTLEIPSDPNLEGTQGTMKNECKLLDDMHANDAKDGESKECVKKETMEVYPDEDNNSVQLERKSSRAIWEEVSEMFSSMNKSPSRNTKRSTTNSTVTVTKPKRAVSKSRPSKPPVQRMKDGSLAKIAPLNAQASLEEFFNKIAPAREQKDDTLDNLKGKLLSRAISPSPPKTSKVTKKPKKLETGLPGEVKTTENPKPAKAKKSNSMLSTSSNMAKDLRPPKTVPNSINNSKKKLKAESQPNFLKPTSASALKKTNSSEPHINKTVNKSSSVARSVSPKPKTISQVTAQVKSKTPPQVKKPVLDEFTVSTSSINPSPQQKAKPKQDIQSKKASDKPTGQERRLQTVATKKKFVPTAFNNLTLGPQDYLDKSFAAFARKSKTAFLNSLEKEESSLVIGQKRNSNIPGSSSNISQANLFTAKGFNIEDNELMLSLFQAYLQQSIQNNRPSFPIRLDSNDSLLLVNQARRIRSPSPSKKPQSSAHSLRPLSPFTSARKTKSANTTRIASKKSAKTKASKESLHKDENSQEYIDKDRIYLITKSGHTIPLCSASNQSLTCNNPPLKGETLKPSNSQNTNQRPKTVAAVISSTITSQEKVSNHSSTSEVSSMTDVNSNTNEGSVSDSDGSDRISRRRLRRNRQVKRKPQKKQPSDVRQSSHEITDEDIHRYLKQKAGVGLVIYPELMENVQLHHHRITTSKTHIKKIDKPLMKSTSTSVELDNQDNMEDDNQRVQRRVSFSDPIAVFKTMSPQNLAQEREKDEISVDDEDNEAPFRLRRMFTQLYN